MRFVVPKDWRSWIAVEPDSEFPIQNLPFGRFVDPRSESDEIGVRIGNQVLSLRAMAGAGLLDDGIEPMLVDLSLTSPSAVSNIRRQVAELLKDDDRRLRDDVSLRDEAFLPAEGLEMLVPMYVHGFVDFYSGIHHATNVGKMFRPDQPPLLPNYRHIPIAYNGRASSVIVSGEPIRRPKGQTKGPNDPVPIFGPTKELDFELEMGFFVGSPNPLGQSIPIQKAEDHILGLALVNDWSARDVQRWEYQPLGPFLAKSFGTSVSPWIVTLDALEPFRIHGMPQDPHPLHHLKQPGLGHFDVRLEVAIQTKSMAKPQIVCRSNTSNIYWTMAQQIAHLTSNGANLEAGDLCASGTISGADPDSFGSMLELSWKGEKPLTILESGETRTFLEDGDTVIFTGHAQGDGFRVGFGEVRGTVLPALPADANRGL